MDPFPSVWWLLVRCVAASPLGFFASPELSVVSLYWFVLLSFVFELLNTYTKYVARDTSHYIYDLLMWNHDTNTKDFGSSLWYKTMAHRQDIFSWTKDIRWLELESRVLCSTVGKIGQIMSQSRWSATMKESEERDANPSWALQRKHGRYVNRISRQTNFSAWCCFVMPNRLRSLPSIVESSLLGFDVSHLVCFASRCWYSQRSARTENACFPKRQVLRLVVKQRFSLLICYRIG